MKKERNLLAILFNWDKLVFLLAFIIPVLFYTEHAGKLILITLICVLSKSNMLNGNMKVEVHSFLIAVTANIYGLGAGLLVTFVANSLELKVGPKLGATPNPMFLITDFFYMVVLSFVAAAVPTSSLMLAALITIVVVDHVLINVLRFATLPDKPRQWMQSLINVVVTFLLFSKLLAPTLAYLA